MMEMNTIQEFLAVLSSKAPVPGGGGASALAGALGNALGQMVANLTIGKKRYADVEEEICGLLMRMEGLQAEFVRLADRDAEVFAPLAQCYSLPAATPEERAWLAALGDRPEDFAALWACKESMGKESGYGLPYPPSRLSVPLPGDGGPLRPGEAYLLEGRRLRVYAGRGWRGAVCAWEEPPEEIRWLSLP